MRTVSPGNVLVCWLASIAGVRLVLALSHPTFLGIDGGAYLLGMFQFWAAGPEQAGFARPPLAPGYFLVPFVSAFGLTPLAYNLYAAVFSMALWPAVWILARRILSPWWAVGAVVLVSLDWEQWVMFVTGVVPVVGFAGLTMALWAMIANKPRWLLLIIPFIALTNQTSAGLGVITLAAAWIALPHKKQLAIYLLAGGLLALAIGWPWYAPVLPGQDKVAVPGGTFYMTPFSEYQWYEGVGILLLLLAVNKLWDRAGAIRPELTALCYVVAAHTALLLIWSRDETIQNVLFRGGIWVMVPIWILVAWLGSEVAKEVRPWIGKALVAISLLVGIAGSAFVYGQQDLYSDHMSKDVLAALESINPETITRIGTNGESRAYWLSAISGNPVVWVQPAPPQPAYVEQEHQARCELGWLQGCAVGFVSHWIIDRMDRQQVPAPIESAPDPGAPWSDLGLHAPWLELVFTSGDVEVWAYPTASPAALSADS